MTSPISGSHRCQAVDRCGLHACLQIMLCALICQCLACNRASQSSSKPQATQTKEPHTAGANQADKANVGGSTAQAAGPHDEHYVATPFTLPRVKNPGYVGFEKCAQCHKERVAECLPSSHFQTCRQPDLKRIPAAFTSSDPADRSLELPGADVTFTMSIKGDKFLQSAIRKSTGARTDSTIDWIYGAKPTSDEVYLSWHADDSMWELPAAWLYSHNCWGAAGFDRSHGTDFARELTVRCFECHNTWFEHVPGTLSTYRREGLLAGVTCERCHGPGQEHVDFHQAHPEVAKSEKILLPSSLERERLIEVCVQCHGNAIRHKGPALSYRPGQPLAEHYRSVAPKYSEDDHVADQITRLRKSKCFQNSEMTCITCHDPHLTSDAPHGMTFQETCTQCHDSHACKQRDQLPAGVADNCVQCHMRKFAKVNVNFDTAHDAYVPPVQRSQHQIGVDMVATREVLLGWYQKQTDADSKQQAAQLQQQLEKHWLEEGASLAGAGRYTAASAAIRELLRVAPESAEGPALLKQYTQQQRQFDDLLNQAEHLRNTNRDKEALELFQQVLKIRPDNTKAIGRTGAIYYKLGDRQQAESYLKRVAEVDPDDQYGLSMMAWQSLNNGEFARAVQLYEQADAIEPYNSKLNGLWGIALLKDGRTAAGVKRLLVACESDPKNLQAIRELVKVHLEQQQLALAESWAVKAVQLTDHQSLPDLMNLAECCLTQNKRRRAADVADIALKIARQVNPAAAQEIERWASAQGVVLAK